MSPNDSTTDGACDLHQQFAPVRAADDATFEELAEAYNFRTVSHRVRLMVRLLLKEIAARSRPARVLDIGCGGGMSVNPDWAQPAVAMIRSVVDEYWGIEPDASVSPPEGIFDRHQHCLLEEADLPPNSVDVAYAFMVVEHVDDPRAFLEAVHRILKPGGCFLFLTPNARHILPRTIKLLTALGLDELALRLVRGRKTVDAYHYPVRYRMNDEASIRAAARRAGFAKMDFIHEEDRGVKPYFPGPLRPIYHLLRWKRAMIKNPHALMYLYCRLVKAEVNSNA